MVLNKTIAIDLAKYGGDGYVEVGYPSFRRLKLAERNATKYLTKVVNGVPQIVSDGVIEADMERMMAYIESAPFPLSVDGFFEFTDSLDKIKRGSGEEFYRDVVEAIEKVKDGSASPSPSSPEAENGSSGLDSSQTS